MNRETNGIDLSMEEVTPKANVKAHKSIFGFSQGKDGNLTFN
jgi:hypothetical protein